MLMKAAALDQGALREIDVAARYGGEEFARDPARHRPRRRASRGRSHPQAHRGALPAPRALPPVTISGGVATFPDDAKRADELLRRADEGLYRAKAAGKNCIAVAAGERRRYPRLPARHAVSVSGSGLAEQTQTRDISEGGLRVRLKEPVPLGSSVSLVVRPVGGQPFGLRGRVVRVESAGSGSGYDVGVRLLSGRSRGAVALRRLAGNGG